VRELRPNLPNTHCNSLIENTPLWRVLCVQPSKQQQIASLLDQRYSIETYNPTYSVQRRYSRHRTREVARSIFEGYLFARFAWTIHGYALMTGGVHSVLSFAGQPAELSEQEMEEVRLISLSPTPARVLNNPPEIGKPVEITYGAMCGRTGILIRKRGELQFVVNCGGIAVAVIVARDQVKSV
jgi:transcription antitermination factor NusG